MRIRRALGTAVSVLLLSSFASTPAAHAANGTLSVDYSRCKAGTGIPGVACLPEKVSRSEKDPQDGKCFSLLTENRAKIRKLTNGTNRTVVYYTDRHCTRGARTLGPGRSLTEPAVRSVRYPI
ncbi:hypothetical protein GO001_20595 [Streptomyces sp. NRRL B-1677]|uniref:Uncharacterized protein n=1 Tax=Streptomyces klenkii TaxID=1420899 RepID=A0A3B0BH60_9ACTN|nr:MULTISPECIES: hypothetical protein [Streptomyces]MBF6047609.1 hypothetical protein [Streptomyces sp. NRRL B-1677]RKN71639.1 hypothetical protein D7231_16700 [Streptomyces klenkii]